MHFPQIFTDLALADLRGICERIYERNLTDGSETPGIDLCNQWQKDISYYYLELRKLLFTTGHL